ncbi:uncharacterized protein LOC142399558 [Odontesthes bonariensis]|uniref:uncharacterized protein LOC142399558 n=1 Tax=Odontesthes bonariensis TaxID=219752 RepID=UPI003F590038
MASHHCRVCMVAMSTADGHRECPTCLGAAHVLEDVDNPCSAAVDLLRGERLRRANLVSGHMHEGRAEGRRSPHRSARKHGHKRTRKCSRDRQRESPHRSDQEGASRAAKRPVPAEAAEGGSAGLAHILSALQGLSRRMDRLEGHQGPPSLPPSLPPGQEGPPLRRPESHGEEEDWADTDVLSLHASQTSDATGGGSRGGELHTGSRGLQPPTPDPAPYGGAWEGVSHASPPPSIPVAEDYTKMLRTAWGKTLQRPQFNPGCRQLAMAVYPAETGLGDMPPVEASVASWTSLGPARASPNPRCPRKECAKTDRLASRSFNASARAARMGNALAMTLAALRKTLDPADGDAMALVEAALSAHSQLTRDVGDSMASAVLCRRQDPRRCWTVPNVPQHQGRLSNGLVSLRASAFRQLPRGQPHIPSSGGGGEQNQTGAETQAGAVARRSSQGLPVGCPSQLSRISWEGIVPDPWVVTMVAHGYRLQFRRRPPVFSGVRITAVRDPILKSVLDNEVRELLLKGAISEVPPSAQRAGFYSKYFIVPKKDGSHRPVLDLRPLNQYLKVLPFKMVHTAVVIRSIQQGEWFTSLDLKDTYFHVPICPEHRPYLRFAFRGRAFQFQVLPFGLSLAPRVFSRVVSAALAPLQAQGLKILPYLDDWLVCAHSQEQVVRDTETLLAHIQFLGFVVNWKKSNLRPRQQAEFLGILLDSAHMKASLTGRRVDSLIEALKCFRLGGLVTAHRVQRLLGLMAAAAVVVPLGLLRSRPFQCWFNAFRLHPRDDRQVRLRVSRACIRALRPWRSREFLLSGVPLGGHPHRRQVISTDASLTGWGAVWEGRSVWAIWQPPWTSEHINVLELKAIHLALQRFLPTLQHSHVLVRSDSTSAVYHVNHQGGTKSQKCLQVAEELLTWAWPRLASLRAVHVPGVENGAADMLSRTGPLPGEWRLHTDVVNQIWMRYRVAQVDLFASAETTHCPEWFSLRGQGGSLGLDALSKEWPIGLLYAFPPLPLIPQVLQRIKEGQHTVLLVAPRWPARPWFSDLLQLLQGQPWRLPSRADLLSQADGKVWHPNPAALRLWVWPLQSRSLIA